VEVMGMRLMSIGCEDDIVVKVVERREVRDLRVVQGEVWLDLQLLADLMMWLRVEMQDVAEGFMMGCGWGSGCRAPW
jgi:hypothetical protein